MEREKYVKPSINVYVNSDIYSQKLMQILYGIEEEGIPYNIVIKKETDCIDMAISGAKASKLGVGVGVDENLAIVYYDKLKTKTPLFKVSVEDSLEEFRILGKNSARLVKRMPFYI